MSWTVIESLFLLIFKKEGDIGIIGIGITSTCRRRLRYLYDTKTGIGTPRNVTRNDAIVSALIADVAARVAHPFAYESPLRRHGLLIPKLT